METQQLVGTEPGRHAPYWGWDGKTRKAALTPDAELAHVYPSSKPHLLCQVAGGSQLLGCLSLDSDVGMEAVDLSVL